MWYYDSMKITVEIEIPQEVFDQYVRTVIYWSDLRELVSSWEDLGLCDHDARAVFTYAEELIREQAQATLSRWDKLIDDDELSSLLIAGCKVLETRVNKLYKECP